MNANLGQHLTLLGLCSMIFYGVMVSTGLLPIDVLPQFAVSAIIFLTSGRMMKKAARQLARDEEEEEEKQEKKKDSAGPDWPWLTTMLNWCAAFAIIGLMAIILMKPIGLTLDQALSFTVAPDQYFAGAVP